MTARGRLGAAAKPRPSRSDSKIVAAPALRPRHICGMKDVDAAERSVTTTVTHLVMDGPPAGHPPPSPLLRTAILLAENPAPHFYRYLYETIGTPYLWV